MNNKLILIVGGTAAGICGTAIGMIAHQVRKMNRMLKKIGLSYEKVRDESEKEIAQEIRQQALEDAIARAVDVKAERAIRNAEQSVLADVKSEIQKHVKTAVAEEAKTVRDKVSDEIAVQAGRIDEEDLRREVTEKAKKEIMRKFDGCLNGVLSDFNHSLGNVRDIYESIAKTISKSGDSGKEVVFKM